MSLDPIKEESDEPENETVPTTRHAVQSAEDVIDVVKLLCLSWHQHEIVHSRVAGGLTNSIFRACRKDHPDDAVLIRVFGGKDVFSAAARQRENDIYRILSNHNVAPKLLGLFENGRLEKWLNARPIDLNEMTHEHIGIGVANKMAQLHMLTNILLQELQDSSGNNEVQLWANLENWSLEARRLAGQGRFRLFNVEKLFECYKTVKKQLVSLNSPIVFAHNDVLCGNILVSLTNPSDITLVDFEYGSRSHRGFDIGNFFCEAMGGTIDGNVHPTKYPTLQFRRLFCGTYLKHFKDAPTAEEVDALVHEARQFEQAAHLYWGFWGLVQSATSDVDFPYERFSGQRFKEFYKLYNIDNALELENSP